MLLPWPAHAHMTQMDVDIVYYVAGFISNIVKKAVAWVACGDVLGENSALEINIEGMIPENCQFFVDEINRGGHVKPSYLIYAICALAWDIYLQIMENSEAKSLFLSFKAHRSVFLNIMYGQATENTKYVDILDTIGLKSHRFYSLLSNILSKFFNVICKNFVSEINSNIRASKKERKKDDKPDKQSRKIKKTSI